MGDCGGKCDTTTRKTTVTWSPETYEYKLPNETTYITIRGTPDQLDKAVKAEVDAYIKKTDQLSAPRAAPVQTRVRLPLFSFSPKILSAHGHPRCFRQHRGAEIVWPRHR